MNSYVDPRAKLGIGNRFGPGVVIGPDVEVGDYNELGPYVCLSGRTLIGNGNVLLSHVAIGGPSRQRLRPDPWIEPPNPSPVVRIGDESFFFEHVVVTRPLRMTTEVGDRVSIGAHAHIAHDVRVGHEVIISPNVSVGGYGWVGEGANLGLGVSVHNRVAIGGYAMVGMNAAVTHHVRPGVRAAGLPTRYVGVNDVGLDRSSLSEDQVAEIRAWIADGLAIQDERARDLVEVWETAVALSGRDRMPI